jgi:hypothetical protein
MPVIERCLSERQRTALAALRGREGWTFVRDLGLDGSAIGWGVTLASLERCGLVESTYPSVESAGVPKVWRAR